MELQAEHSVVSVLLPTGCVTIYLSLSLHGQHRRKMNPLPASLRIP